MKRAILSALLLSLLLLPAACGSKQSDAPSVSSSGSSPSVSSSAPNAGAMSSAPASSAGAPSGPAPLTAEETAAAREAAYAYYKATVFAVQALTEIAPRSGELSFQVACTKGGVPQDPDRIISLERQDGAWVVVDEGY